MFDLETIDKAIYDWVSEFTQTTTIWRNENAPSPILPYITIFRESILPVGSESFINVDVAGISTYGSINKTSLQVEYFGRNGAAVLESLSHSMLNEYYRIILRTAGMSVLKFNEIRDLSSLQDTKFEKRFQTIINMLLGTEFIVSTEIIESVEMTGKIHNKEVLEKTFIIND